VLPLRLPVVVLPVPVPVVFPVPRFALPVVVLPIVPVPLVFPVPPVFPIFVFIMGVGDIIGVLIVFMFDMFALRALTLTLVFPASPQPNEPVAIKSEAVIMVFLMVSPVSKSKK
jgi:hypothetical protein